MHPNINNFALVPKKKPPRFQNGIKQCVECGKLRGVAYQTQCDNCGKMVCIDCRRDETGNAGFRSRKYICHLCKDQQQNWANNVLTPNLGRFQVPQQQHQAVTENIFTKMAQVNESIAKGDDAQNLLDELFGDIF